MFSTKQDARRGDSVSSAAHTHGAICELRIMIVRARMRSAPRQVRAGGGVFLEAEAAVRCSRTSGDIIRHGRISVLSHGPVLD
jgi:hypothetical protein